MPLIVADIMTYLCGGFHDTNQNQNNGSIESQIVKANKLLIERVPNARQKSMSKKPTKEILGSSKATGDEQQSKKLKFDYLTHGISLKITDHLKAVVPPLKAYPEVYESDHSIDSDDPRVEHIKSDIQSRFADVQFLIQQMTFRSEAHKKSKDFYMALAKVNPKKQAKIKAHNSNLPIEKHEHPVLRHFELTEQSLKDSFKQVFGASCDIFSTLLYVKAAKQMDYIRLNYCDLIELFIPLLVSLSPSHFHLLTNAIEPKQTDAEQSCVLNFGLERIERT
jgi:hypothetical protein